MNTTLATIIVFTAISNLNGAWDSDKTDELQFTFNTNYMKARMPIISLPTVTSASLNST
jgi:hypothetical protein